LRLFLTIFAIEANRPWSKNMEATEMMNPQDIRPYEGHLGLRPHPPRQLLRHLGTSLRKRPPLGATWHPVLNGVAGVAQNLRRFPLRFNGIRGPIQARIDFGLIKNFAITERWRLQFRPETFNVANYANLSNPNTTVTSGAFGTITGQDPPRSWQGALKLTF